MKWSKNLISLAVAVIFGLSLILVPAVSQVSPVQAAITWTKSTTPVTLQGETYVEDAWVIKDGAIYKMWYTHGETDLTITQIVSSMTTSLGLSPIISDITSLALVSFLGHLGSVNITEARNLLDGTSTVIGYATSTNRVTWEVQDSEALAGSGEAWNSVGAPCVIKVTDNDYRMWYTRVKTDLTLAELQPILTNLGVAGERKDALLDLINSTRTVIGYATWDGDSEHNWIVRDSPVLAGSGPAWDSVADPCVIKVSDNDYRMWVTQGKTDVTQEVLDAMNAATFGIDDLLEILDGTRTVIGYTTSTNGITDWGATEEVLAGNGSAWNSVANPSVVTGSSYEMWYTQGKTNLTTDNLSSLLDEAAELANQTWNILKDFGAGGDFEQLLTDLTDLDISTIEDLLGNTRTVIGYATLENGTWEVQSSEHLVGSTTSAWSSVANPSVVKSGTTYEMWYTEGIKYLTKTNLVLLVLGIDLPIGYATYTPVVPPYVPPYVPPEEEDEDEEVAPEVVPPTAEELEEMTPEEAAEELEEMTAEDAAELIEEVTTETAVDIVEEVTTETAVDIIEGVTTETAVDIVEGVSTETAIDIVEGVTTETAVDIVEGVTTETAVDIVEGVTTETAVDIVEGVTTETAVDIVEGVTTETAVDIVEGVTTETAVDIIEEVVTDKAADILEEVAVKKAAAIMEEVTTGKLNDLVGEMSEDPLMDRLPEVSTDTLHSIDVVTLFDALPSAPTEQLTSEEPPIPPADLEAPIVRYVHVSETGVETKYVALRTISGEWVVVMGTPSPIDQLMIKTKRALENVETTVEIVEELPPGVTVGLPAGQIVLKYANITFENATPEDIELGHLAFHVENEWLEQNSIHKWSVVLSRYDPELEQWISLPTKRVGEDDTYIYYTVIISRFSTFAISGSQVVPPLEFKTANLVIEPIEAETGEAITISADVTNLSDTAGIYVATLWIDSTVEAGQDIYLEAGEKTTVSFDVTKDKTGSYQVRIGRQMGSFEVLPPLPPVVPKPAAFEVSQLSIAPAEVKIGKVVTISAVVTNIGEVEGSYDAVLEINGVPVATETVTLGAGESTKVVFSVTRDAAATYQVSIERQTGSFKVLPPIVPKPAAFKASQLSITPAEVKIGEVVTISAVVTNIGEVEGSYEAVLKVDGVPVATETVTLGAGESTKVVFSVTRDVAATYQVEVDGRYDKFTVVKPVPPPVFPWWWIVVGVVVIGLLVFFLVIRRRAIEG